MRTLVAAFVVSVIAVPAVANAGNATTCIEAETQHLTHARPYVAIRRLEAENQKSGKAGWMEVRTELTADRVLTIEVLAEGGSSYIRGKVLRPFLEGEQQLVRAGIPARAPVGPADYQCSEPVEQDLRSSTVHVTALRKMGNLLNGEMVVDTGTGAVTEIRGQLAKNPSFWVSRASVHWRYGRVAGALVPVELDSTAHVKMFGPSTFRMTYRYESVDGRPAGLQASR